MSVCVSGKKKKNVYNEKSIDKNFRNHTISSVFILYVSATCYMFTGSLLLAIAYSGSTSIVCMNQNHPNEEDTD